MRALRRAIAAGALWTATVVAQSPHAQLLITSPTADDVLSGVVTLSAEITPANVKVRAVTFFVDGIRACTASSAPFRCQWDSATVRGVRDVRAVAELADGTRVVHTVRTRGTVAAFRTGVDSVTVAVRVRDRYGRFVRGLGADSFRLFEDGMPQEIATLTTESSGGDVILALDGSGSMTAALAELRAAARAFLDALPRNDNVTVTVFNSAIDVLSPRGANVAESIAALDRLRASGTTALYDVMIQAVDLFPPAAERRAIVMFTDGDDVASRASIGAARQALQGANVVLYVIAQGKASTDSALQQQLTTIATETGGAAFFASKMSDTRDHFSEIAEELSNQYVLGYVPTRAFGDGAWRQIRVETADPTLHYQIKSRQGYLATRRTGQ